VSCARVRMTSEVSSGPAITTSGPAGSAYVRMRTLRCRYGVRGPGGRRHVPIYTEGGGARSEVGLKATLYIGGAEFSSIQGDVYVDESREPKDELSGDGAARGDAAEVPAEDASPADVFEHLARIRSGISDGVVTLW
jgi:hypothetical protein